MPTLRFSGFSEDWSEQSLGELLEFKNGYNAPKESYGSGEKFINVLDIIQNTTITHEKILGSVELSKEEFEKYKVEYGDILFQRSSETREEVGQANVYLDSSRPATFGGFVIRGKKVGDFDPAFMNYLLRTPRSRNEITSKSGGSTRYNVGQETLSQVPVILPSLPEQQKIAAFLTSVDQRIELLQAKKEKLEGYKKGVMQKIFAQQLSFKADDGSDFPDWEERKLGEVCEKKSSNITAGSLAESDGHYRIYGATGFLQNVDFFQVETAFISIVKDRAGVGRVLKCEPKSSVLGTLDMILPKKEIDIDFLFSALARINFLKYMTGSTIPHIYFKDYAKERIKLPSLPEQKKISKFLTTLDQSIENLNQQINQTQTWKKGLLQKMFV